MQIFELITVVPRLMVCDGCCCGRMEKGNDAVPIDMLKTAWEEHGLKDHVKLSISGCLGPCSMKNVSLMTHGTERIWLGELGGTEHYDALISWAKSIAKGEQMMPFPDALKGHQFKPNSA
mgnify:CR=1 FL=1